MAKFPKINPLITFKEIGSQFIQGITSFIAGLYNIFSGIIKFVTLPIWFPLIYIFLVVKYGSYLERINKEKEDQINRLFFQTQKE